MGILQPSTSDILLDSDEEFIQGTYLIWELNGTRWRKGVLIPNLIFFWKSTKSGLIGLKPTKGGRKGMR